MCQKTSGLCSRVVTIGNFTIEVLPHSSDQVVVSWHFLTEHRSPAAILFFVVLQGSPLQVAS